MRPEHPTGHTREKVSLAWTWQIGAKCDRYHCARSVGGLDWHQQIQKKTDIERGSRRTQNVVWWVVKSDLELVVRKALADAWARQEGVEAANCLAVNRLLETVSGLTERQAAEVVEQVRVKMRQRSYTAR